MFEQALIDGLKFAREGRCLQGLLPLSRLPRVAEELFDASGSVSYELTGFVDGNGRPGIEAQTRTQLPMVCQRCLDRFDFDLERRTRFLLVSNEAQLPDLEDEAMETETVSIEAVTNVADLVEQEVLLGMPIAPAHPAGQCRAPEQPQAAKPDSPFAVLGQLKRAKPVK